MENSSLLRIGILILVGFILYQVIKKSNIFGNNALFSNGPVTQGKAPADNTQLTMVEEKVKLDAGPQYDNQPVVRPHEQTTSQLYDYNYQVLPYPQIATSPQDSYFNQGGICQPTDPGCYSGSTLQAPELLPTDIGDNAWQETSPTVQGHITDQNFLESGHHYGINTVGNSLKNPNTQLRSDPPIAKVNVSPWLNSTVDPDTNRKAFEIQD